MVFSRVVSFIFIVVLIVVENSAIAEPSPVSEPHKNTVTIEESEEIAENEETDDWGDDDWADDTPHNFSQQFSLSYAGLINSQSVNLQNQVLNEFRYTLDYQFQGDSYQFDAELDFLQDWLLDETSVETRELNFSRSLASNTDIKIGRQIITWGTGDLLFLNDLFAKDWQSFFSGREDKYLKSPIDAIRVSYFSKVNFELAFIPEFTPDNVPNGNRLSFFIPGAGLVQPNPSVQFSQPDKPEVALRLYANQDSLEWAIYAYSGYFKSPGKQLPSGEIGFSEMSALGASVSTPAAGGLFNFEVSYYQSDKDKKGDNPLIDNSQFRLLVGYESELANNFTLASQAYLEKTLDYDSLVSNMLPGQIVADENRTMVTARLTHLAIQQTLVNSLMVFYSPSDKDHYLRYSSRYSYSDELKITFGLNLIDGKDDFTFLAQMQDNSNAYIRINYLF